MDIKELFAPNLLASGIGYVRKYNKGDSPVLQKRIGVIVEGVVAVDVVTDANDTVTGCLIGVNGVLNVEALVGSPSDHREFHCETPVTLIEVPIENMLKALVEEPDTPKTVLLQTVAKQATEQLQAVQETLAKLNSRSPFAHRVKWATNRFKSLLVEEHHRISTSRLAKHLAVTRETVSRAKAVLASED